MLLKVKLVRMKIESLRRELNVIEKVILRILIPQYLRIHLENTEKRCFHQFFQMPPNKDILMTVCQSEYQADGWFY